MSGRRRLGSDAGGLGHLAGANAPGADFDVLRTAVHHRADALQVRQPSPLGHVMGVGDVAPAHRALAADLASLRHFRNPPRGPLTVGLNFIPQVTLFFKGGRRSRARIFRIDGVVRPTQM